MAHTSPGVSTLEQPLYFRVLREPRAAWRKHYVRPAYWATKGVASGYSTDAQSKLNKSPLSKSWNLDVRCGTIWSPPTTISWLTTK